MIFSMDQKEADWSVVCQITLLDFPEEECTICFLLVIRDLPWSPAPFKHGRKECHEDIGQLTQHPWMQSGESHGLSPLR